MALLKEGKKIKKGFGNCGLVYCLVTAQSNRKNKTYGMCNHSLP